MFSMFACDIAREYVGAYALRQSNQRRSRFRPKRLCCFAWKAEALCVRRTAAPGPVLLDLSDQLASVRVRDSLDVAKPFEVVHQVDDAEPDEERGAQAQA